MESQLAEAYKKAKKQVQNAEAALSLAQAVAEDIQQQAHNQIAGVVSRCLSAVFDRPYEFRINFERKRGRTEAALTFARDGFEIDPVSGAGGGVVDVTAFALRVACLALIRPRPRQFLALDEPFKFVSERKEYRQRVAQLLDTMATELGIQILMVTHDPTLQIGKVIEVSG